MKSSNVYKLSPRWCFERSAVAAVIGLLHAGCDAHRFEAEPESEEPYATVSDTFVAESVGEPVRAFTSGEPTSSYAAHVPEPTNATGVGVTSLDANSWVSSVSVAGPSDAGTTLVPTGDSADAAATFVTPSSADLDAGHGASSVTQVDLETSDASIFAERRDSGVGSRDAAASDTSAPRDPNACNHGDFGTPQAVLGLGYDDRLWGPSISSDGSVLLFGYTGRDEDLYAAVLETGQDRTFSNVTALTRLNTEGNEGTPFLSYDGLTLYFYATRPGGPGDRDLWFASRSHADEDFDEPDQVLGVNASSYDHLPWVSDDERTLYYTTERDGGLGKSDIWMATRASKAGAFEQPVLMPGVNSEHREDAIAFSPDRLTVFFTTDRETDGDLDIWRATRRSPLEDFGEPEVLAGINSEHDDTNLALTRDGKRLYFSSGRDAQQRLWVASRVCF